MKLKPRRRSHSFVRGAGLPYLLENLVYRESHGFTGGGVLRLQSGVLRVRGRLTAWRGSGGPLRLTSIEIAEIGRVLERCGVWQWKQRYRPSDCREIRLDGVAWSLRVKAGTRRCRREGVYACPGWNCGAYATPDPVALHELVRGIASVIFGQGPSFEGDDLANLVPGRRRMSQIR